MCICCVVQASTDHIRSQHACTCHCSIPHLPYMHWYGYMSTNQAVHRGWAHSYKHKPVQQARRILRSLKA